MKTRKPTAERRREIADAAIKLIGERGLREFTAARLASEVGVKDGTIFSHFKDMKEVAQAVLDRIQERLLESAGPPASDPVERLRVFVLDRFRAAVAHPGMQSLLFSDQLAHALGAEGPARIAALRNRGRAFVRSCLQEAVGKGLIAPDTDVDAAVLVITGVAMGFLFAKKDGALPPESRDIEGRAWQAILLLLRGKAVES